ncbi:hypothetical protein QVD17_30133 [Tagetes erecta]|uniref:Secreted protein n=1 Tax=Tagetes erecta TaxID=13708 RepID=A0AAD8K271_TARER|nr:hypothetical protein QVD17_30133 [Tagetes erecta]
MEKAVSCSFLWIVLSFELELIQIKNFVHPSFFCESRGFELCEYKSTTNNQCIWFLNTNTLQNPNSSFHLHRLLTSLRRRCRFR